MRYASLSCRSDRLGRRYEGICIGVEIPQIVDVDAIGIGSRNGYCRGAGNHGGKKWRADADRGALVNADT